MNLRWKLTRIAIIHIYVCLFSRHICHFPALVCKLQFSIELLSLEEKKRDIKMLKQPTIRLWKKKVFQKFTDCTPMFIIVYHLIFLFSSLLSF